MDVYVTIDFENQTKRFSANDYHLNETDFAVLLENWTIEECECVENSSFSISLKLKMAEKPKLAMPSIGSCELQKFMQGFGVQTTPLVKSFNLLSNFNEQPTRSEVVKRCSEAVDELEDYFKQAGTIDKKVFIGFQNFTTPMFVKMLRSEKKITPYGFTVLSNGKGTLVEIF